MEKRFRGWHQGVLAVLVVSPFLQGLFPVNYQLPAEMLAAVALSMFVFSCGKRRGERLELMDYAAIALSGLYLVATLWGVNRRDAFQEGLKQVLYLAAYWITSRSIRSERDRNWLLTWVGVSATVVALGSVVLATGIIPYKDTALYNRISGPYQYPNVLAAQMFVGIALTASLRLNASDRRGRAIWSAVLFTNVAVFLFTYSRIAWLIAPVVAVLFLILLPKERRFDVVMLGVSLLAGLTVAFAPVDAVLRSGHATLLPVWILVGAGVTAGADWCLQRVRGNRATVIGLGVVAVLVLGVGAGLAVTKSAYLLERLTSYSANDNSALVRLWTYKDATRAWLSESPVMGLGGGGWHSVYLNYRSVAIVSKLTHSSVIETLTEVGLQGVLLLLALWICGLSLAIKAWRKTESAASKIMWAGTIAGLAGLMVHSLLDFDLWYPAATVMVYVLLGVFRSTTETATPLQKGERPHLVGHKVVAGGLIILAVVMVPLEAAGVSYLAAMNQLKGSQFEATRSSLATAIRLDPFNASLYATYGDFLTQYGAQTNSSKDIESGGAILRKAISLSPTNPDYHLLAAQNAQALNNPTVGVEEIEAAVRLDPVGAETYDKAFRIAFDMVFAAINSNRMKDVVPLREAVGRILARYDQSAQSQPADVQSDWLLPRGDGMVEVWRARYQALNGNVSDALRTSSQLANAADGAVKEQALFWSAVFALQTRQDANPFLQALQQISSPLLGNVQVEMERLTRYLSTHT